MNQLAIIKEPIAPLYGEPKQLSALSDEVLHGMVVELIKKVDSRWYYIRTHYGYEGYLQANHLQFNKIYINDWLQSEKMIMKKRCGDIQLHPDVTAPCFASLIKGGCLIPLGEADEHQWQRVRIADGREGYIKTSYLETIPRDWRQQPENDLREKLVATAMCYRGSQYRWGGKTPLGIDCSGLTSMAYMLNGVLIYRDATLKPEFPMKKIPLEQIKKGDLIFFPGHVAMYIENGTYIHSTAHTGTEGVTVNSLSPDSPDYRQDLAESIIYCGSIF